MTWDQKIMLAVHTATLFATVCVLIRDELHARHVGRTTAPLRIEVRVVPARGGGYVAVLATPHPFIHWRETEAQVRADLAGSEGRRLAVFYALAERGRKVIYAEVSAA